ncbi:hypothetical protein G6L63_09665 [Agrobacterium vitis]|uniref:Threonine transporter RhtB n=1 Tax=Agrobacterium vitis TaxID=373 RepID=A0A368NWU0_AGRVI|nr:hypothetical protein [Agrobacterium vitis]KAA3509032.1 hypothetical protein DXM22_21155 [Agrobacterium vitis]KAA3526589.1 hypothetical protein DXT89_14540 [Agrobacterium vitis]MCF1478030.1 hypothetical protein [Agrobacterium vitis]MUZ98787.1 hypothetical protein [Agrobacterium vitis]MVA28884.1 hypothetical protein [Agrobacterium vitis]
MLIATFLPAVLALLLAPGPTNTLMGVAGAQAGLRRVLRLLPAELAGYLTTVLPLVYLGDQLMARWPAAAVLLKIAAAIWVLVIAFKLWQAPGQGKVLNQITAGRIYLTTALNPKALVFGLVLLPAPDDLNFLPYLGLFCLLVSAVALLWGSAGRLTQAGNGGQGRLHVLQRVAAVWLTCVSLSLILGVVTTV